MIFAAIRPKHTSESQTKRSCMFQYHETEDNLISRNAQHKMLEESEAKRYKTRLISELKIR